MSLFSFIRKPNPIEDVTSVSNDNAELTRPEIIESDFIDTKDPNEGRTNLNYATGFPIDKIYEYIEKDWQDEGFQDALNNPDLAFLTTKTEIIRQGLIHRFDLVSLSYTNNIRYAQEKIKTLSALGMLTTMEKFDSLIKTCNEHLEKIESLKESFKKEDPSLMCMIESYKQGFMLGVANKATQECSMLS
ncbi:MAG: hypothetical protein NC083_08820 [Muribaculum sp.]|nr:hypothetical protein [Muribaculum sp.]MCM1577060.1 hypothetical protein [Bacteroides sp.]